MGKFKNSEDINYTDFSNSIIEAANDVASTIKSDSSGWYNHSKHILQPLIGKRSTVLNDIRQLDYSTSTAKEMAKEARKNLSEGISLAKSRWSGKLADRIHDMANYPKDAWKAVFTLKEWLQGHHKTPTIFRLKKKDDSFTETDPKVVELLSKFFHSVYNRKINIDWEVLNGIKDKPKLKYLDVPMSFYEFKEAIKKLVLHKAPGLNGVSPNAIKELNHKDKMILFEICSDVFNNQTEIDE